MKVVVIVELPEEELVDDLLYVLRNFAIEHERADFSMWLYKYHRNLVDEALAVFERKPKPRGMR
jgi:hypothetical protein